MHSFRKALVQNRLIFHKCVLTPLLFWWDIIIIEQNESVALEKPDSRVYLCECGTTILLR